MKPDARNLARCIETPQASLDPPQRSDPAGIEYEVYRNATIEGFELVLETTGKLSRKALKPCFANSTIPILVDVLDRARLPKGFRDEIQKAYVLISPPTSIEAGLHS
uniref:Uncharacterized protein n=1 Tax=Candidatus Kentrum sp. TC TaxID=2126339 RepID=A0A450ZR10_9GAMM|nr:MAG: hypothetical protein BECKTC1821D_GA0114238_10789 [Candidatus Kentron sp. TC]VFK56141.1 MAG: hypothetical protein BECKTC1821F_GA0114240_100931 [Candidatus Kentron sp. TC]